MPRLPVIARDGRSIPWLTCYRVGQVSIPVYGRGGYGKPPYIKLDVMVRQPGRSISARPQPPLDPQNMPGIISGLGESR